MIDTWVMKCSAQIRPRLHGLHARAVWLCEGGPTCTPLDATGRCSWPLRQARRAGDVRVTPHLHDAGMCVKCDGASEFEIALNLADKVQRFGYALQGVEGPGGWVYTVGLTERDHPELLFAGDCVACAAGCLTELSDHVLAGARFEAGGAFVLENGFEATFVKVHPAQIAAGLVASWYRYQGWRGRATARPDVLQVLLSSHPETRPRLDRPVPLLTGIRSPGSRRPPSGRQRRRKRR